MHLLYFFKTLILIALIALGSYIFISMYKPFGKPAGREHLKKSPQYGDGQFENPIETSSADFSKMPNVIRRRINNDVESTPLESYNFNEEKLVPADFSTDSLMINWLGHASVLIHHNGSYILTDPVFSKRASPFGFLGPKRFFDTPISVEDLPAIQAVLISHDHYDHLDYKTITALNDKVQNFVVPWGVAATLHYWDIPDSKIVEMDWWQDTVLGDFKITATPARHFSGRLFKRNNTLWNSYSIKSGDKKVFLPAIRDSSKSTVK